MTCLSIFNKYMGIPNLIANLLTQLKVGFLELLFFSYSVKSNTLWHHGLQHTRLPCPSPSPRTYSISCLLSWWCHPIISSSVVPFSSCLQYFPASESFLMSWLFASGGQSIGASAQQDLSANCFLGLHVISPVRGSASHSKAGEIIYTLISSSAFHIEMINIST